MGGIDEFNDGELDEHEDNIINRIKDDKSESIRR